MFQESWSKYEGAALYLFKITNINHQTNSTITSRAQKFLKKTKSADTVAVCHLFNALSALKGSFKGKLGQFLNLISMHQWHSVHKTWQHRLLKQLQLILFSLTYFDVTGCGKMKEFGWDVLLRCCQVSIAYLYIISVLVWFYVIFLPDLSLPGCKVHGPFTAKHLISIQQKWIAM